NGQSGTTQGQQARARPALSGDGARTAQSQSAAHASAAPLRQGNANHRRQNRAAPLRGQNSPDRKKGGQVHFQDRGWRESQGRGRGAARGGIRRFRGQKVRYGSTAAVVESGAARDDLAAGHGGLHQATGGEQQMAGGR